MVIVPDLASLEITAATVATTTTARGNAATTVANRNVFSVNCGGLFVIVTDKGVFFFFFGFGVIAAILTVVMTVVLTRVVRQTTTTIVGATILVGKVILFKVRLVVAVSFFSFALGRQFTAQVTIVVVIVVAVHGAGASVHRSYRGGVGVTLESAATARVFKHAQHEILFGVALNPLFETTPTVGLGLRRIDHRLVEFVQCLQLLFQLRLLWLLMLLLMLCRRHG